MEKCWEYLGCKQRDCILHGKKTDKPCWEIEGTLCNHHGIKLMRNKLHGTKESICARSGCIYYKSQKIPDK